MAAITKNVLLVLTSHEKIPGLLMDTPTGWYLEELAHPFLRFKREGYYVVIASVNGGHTTVNPQSLKDADDEAKGFWDNSDYRTLTENTLRLEDLDGTKFDAVFFVGGHGTMFDFPKCSALERISREVFERGGIVSGVCHGPIAFCDIHLTSGELLIRGRRVTGFSNEEEDQAGLGKYLPKHEDGKQNLADILTDCGALYSKGPAWKPYTVTDERIMTGQNPASARPLSENIVRELKKGGATMTQNETAATRTV